MKKQTVRLTAAFLMLIATLGSCVKGDKGDTGAAGANGTNGTNGTNGLNGSANVNWSTATTGSSSWTWSSSGRADGAAWTWGNVTQGIVDSGSVFAYLSNGAGGWEQLPFTYYGTGTGAVSLTYYFVYYLNGVTVWVANSNNSDIASTLNGSTYTFKFLTVTPALRRANPNTNWNDYKQAQIAINEANPQTN